MQGVGGCLGLGMGPCVRREGKSVLLEERQVEAPAGGGQRRQTLEDSRACRALGPCCGDVSLRDSAEETWPDPQRPGPAPSTLSAAPLGLSGAPAPRMRMHGAREERL